MLIVQSYMTCLNLVTQRESNTNFWLVHVPFVCYSSTFIHDAVARIERGWVIKAKQVLSTYKLVIISLKKCTRLEAFEKIFPTQFERINTSAWHVLQQTLHWRHNGRDSVSNHRRLDCLLNRLFRRRSTKISKLRVTAICEGSSPVTGEFPSKRASNTENVSIRLRHHETFPLP